MTKQPDALRLAGELESGLPVTGSAAAELRRLHEENAKLRTVMVAAAEEISAHWDAHCDADGYGPANLMHRLEKGIAAEYGYTAGAFAKQNARIAALEEEAARWQHMLDVEIARVDPLVARVIALETALEQTVEALECLVEPDRAKLRRIALATARQTLGGEHAQ